MDASKETNGGAKKRPIHFPRKSTPGLKSFEIISDCSLPHSFCVDRSIANTLNIAANVDGIFTKPKRNNTFDTKRS
jgi:hypothetical protein